MKRSVVVLGILGLVYAVALPAASAAVLWQPDLSTGKLVGPMVGGKEAPIFTQGVNPQTVGADSTTKDNPGIKPFVVVTDANAKDEFDNDCNCNKTVGWLDDGDMDGVGDGSGDDLDPDLTARVYPGELLTGDPTWADVSIQSKMVAINQNGGTGGFVLRAAPKTKKEDPDSFYVLLYTSSDEGDLNAMARDGIKPAKGQVKDRDGSTDRTIDMRILKVVKGKWTLLAEQGAATSPVHIPRINRLGVDHDVNKDPSNDGNGDDVLTGYYFRFTAKGNVLTGYVSKDAQNWDQVLQATDNDLTAGQVGFFDYGFHILHKEILVQTVP
jgi:hypothetical protein